MTKVIPWLIIAVVAVFRVSRLRARRGGRSGHRAMFPAILGNDIVLIAAREVRHRVRGRAFRVVSVLMVLGVAAAVVVPTLRSSGQAHERVGVVAGPVDVQSLIAAAGRGADTATSVVAESDETSAERDLLAGRVDLFLVGNERVVTKTVLSADDSSRSGALARAIAASVGERNATQAAGLTPSQVATLQAARPLPLVGLRPATRQGQGSGQATARLGVILLFLLLTQYNTWTLIGVMEEKASRVVEVLLATVRPVELLAGKVLGIGLLVFVQAGLVVATALGAATAVGSDLLHGAGPATVVNLLVWLVLGYAFYSWVYAAAGSMAERQDQVQSLAIPIAAPMILGYIMALAVASSGSSSTLFDVLAYLPPTAPFAMPVLVGLGDVSWWQVLISALLTVACTVAVARLAAAVYRRAVLRTGRRVRLGEVLGRGRS